MVIVGFRDAGDRFSHIDASFVGTSLILPDGAQSVCVKYETPTTDATYSVCFYPYWEHPLYQAAIRAGKSPNVGHTEEDKIIVTVVARRVYEFAIERRTDVIDWGFSEGDHPLLWPYHDSVQVHCVSSLTPSQVADLIDLARTEGREYLNIPSTRAPFFGIRQFYEWARHGNFQLGRFPTPLFERIAAYLDSIGAEYSVPFPPKRRDGVPKLFLADGDYIIADDFEVEIPPIVHKNE
ncbi:MAG: hypothetical protein ACR2JW_16555 [Thermomicrobiales bacterium]